MEWVTVEKENCYNWCNYDDLIKKVKPFEFKAFEKTTNLLFRQKLWSLEISKISWKIIWEGHYHHIGQTVSYIKYCILKNILISHYRVICFKPDSAEFRRNTNKF